jgi:hypothetical protein
MSNNNPGNFVRATGIVSPISGQLSKPKIVERIVDGKLHVEAHWYDPASGAFIRKGTVEVRDLSQNK